MVAKRTSACMSSERLADQEQQVGYRSIDIFGVKQHFCTGLSVYHSSLRSAMPPDTCRRGAIAIQGKCGGFRAAGVQGGGVSAGLSLRHQYRLPRSSGSKICGRTRPLTSVFKADERLARRNGGCCMGRMRMDGGESESWTGILGSSREKALNQKSRRVPKKSMRGLPNSEGNQVLKDLDEEEATALDGRRAEMTRETEAKKGREWRLFGVEMTPDTVAIATVYFVQGILGLSRLAVSFFLKDDLHLDPAETALMTGVSSFPWLIKPLYGFISDGVPLFGYRRRSYLVLCGLLGTVSWGSLAILVNDKYTAVLMILLSSLSVAFSDVVVDSMVVERARGESQSTSGSLQSLCWGSSAFGGIFSAYFSGYFVQTYGVRFVFGVTALLPLITSAIAGLVTEKPVSLLIKGGNEGSGPESQFLGFRELSKKQIGYLWQTVKEPNILLPTLFIFFWQATPTSDTAMFFFTTNKLGFGPEFLGRVRLVASVASLAGVALYNQMLKDVPLWKMFLWTTSLGTALGFTQLMLVTGLNRELGISDEWFALGDSLVLTVLGQVSFMPVLVLAAKLCPPGLEATLFATLMSISNGGGVAGGIVGAWLTGILGITGENFNNLAMLIVLCNLSSLLPLPFLGLLPSETDLATAVEDAQKALSESSKAD